MDGSRFDALTQSLMAAGSRRRALVLALGGTLAPLLAREETEAKNKKKKACPPCNKRKKGKCKAKLPDGTSCSGGTCQGGSCIAAMALPPPLAQPIDQCQGRDVCAQGSAAACGPPGNECYCWVTEAGASICGGNDGALPANNCDECARMGRVCVRGGGINCLGPVVCVLPCCPAGTRECGDRCVDVLRDPDNCGECGRRCGIDRPNVCAGGSCCIDAGGAGPCRCSPSGGACAPVGQACCNAGSCANGVCP